MPDHFTLVRGGARRHRRSCATCRPGSPSSRSNPRSPPRRYGRSTRTQSDRIDDLAVLTDRALPDRIAAAGATRIGFREIRDLQRSRR
ncbi:MAG: hypothetical protein R2695_01520 [Acidimicrobiales bacterium]